MSLELLQFMYWEKFWIMAGKNLRKFYSNENRLIIYQSPLADRLMGMQSIIMFIFISFIGFIKSTEGKTILFFGFLLTLILGFVMFFVLFKSYICCDFKKNKLIIRHYPGFKKEEINLECVKGIYIIDLDNDKNKDLFSIDIVCSNHVKKILSWSIGPGTLPFFGSKISQKKRLIEFANLFNETFDVGQKQKNNNVHTSL